MGPRKGKRKMGYRTIRERARERQRRRRLAGILANTPQVKEKITIKSEVKADVTPCTEPKVDGRQVPEIKFDVKPTIKIERTSDSETPPQRNEYLRKLRFPRVNYQDEEPDSTSTVNTDNSTSKTPHQASVLQPKNSRVIFSGMLIMNGTSLLNQSSSNEVITNPFILSEDSNEKRSRRKNQHRVRDETTMAPTAEEFPALTTAMERLIDASLYPASTSTCVAEFGCYTLSSVDVSVLNNLNWCNEQVVDFYLALIANRSNKEGYPRVCSYSTSFYTELKTKGESYVISKYTKHLDPLTFHIFFIPIFVPFYREWNLEHWTLVIIDLRVKKIMYYDPLPNPEEKLLETFQKYLAAEMKEKYQATINLNTYKTEIVKEFPESPCVTYCGIFILKAADYYSRNAKCTFTQKQVPYFRRKILYELLTKEL